MRSKPNTIGLLILRLRFDVRVEPRLAVLTPSVILPICCLPLVVILMSTNSGGNALARCVGYLALRGMQMVAAISDRLLCVCGRPHVLRLPHVPSMRVHALQYFLVLFMGLCLFLEDMLCGLFYKHLLWVQFLWYAM